MKRQVSLLIQTGALIVALTLGAQGQTDPSVPGPGPTFSAGLSLGYLGGTAGQVSGRVSDFATGFPLSARLGVGYASVEPGKSAAARQVFINDATNGIPEESGNRWDFRLDLLYPVDLLSLPRAYIYGGPRYSRFKANFKYIGGNEDFDVLSNQWGFGSGLESNFSVSPRFDLVITTGLDYFQKATLSGHDTAYSPGGDDSNGRDGYTYDDADDAIDQPGFELQLMVGFSYRL
jgi:hypothetical protein